MNCDIFNPIDCRTYCFNNDQDIILGLDSDLSLPSYYKSYTYPRMKNKIKSPRIVRSISWSS